MSTTEIRDTSTDNYFVLTQYDASNNLEVAVAQALVQSAYNYATIDPIAGVYTSPANESSWNCLDISANFSEYINTSAISNYPAGTVTEHSVISSKLITTDVSINSYPTYMSNPGCDNNLYNFETTNTTSSYYDSNYVITQSLIAECSDNYTGNYVTGTFDLNNSNVKIQYAMQSRWNTTVGPYTDGLNTVGQDPTAMTQDEPFNTSSAFAQYGSGSTDASYVSYWFSCNNDGSLMPNIVDASYQPIENNLLVGDRDLSGVTFDVNNDIGIFRIQKPGNVITTKVALDDASQNFINTNDLNNMPLFDGYGTIPLTYDSSKNLLHIPGNMDQNAFESLFNLEVFNTVADDWTFTIDISSNNGGYAILENHPLISDLSNDNLLDNPYYMENYVSNDHSITFSNSGITLDVSTNGIITDISSILINLSAGETLLASDAGVDGQIIINTNTINTRYTDLSSVDLSGNFTPAIYYSNDGELGLSVEEMENPYFEGMWQKVAQQSSVTSSDYYLKQSNNSIMTLYTDGGGIVDSSYSATDFDYSFNSALFGASNDIRLWEINGSNNIIVNPQSLFKDPSYSQVEDGFSTAGSLTGLQDEVVYNTYRLLLTAKNKESINLHNAVTDVSGWVLSYSDPSMSYLYTSSDQAYSQVALPYNSGPSIIPAINNGTNINYSYTYYTVEEAGNIGGLVDYVDISYNYNGPQLITIPQTDIIRNYTDISYSYVVIDPSAYSFIGTFFNKAVWELVDVSSVSIYNASFPSNYGPFINIKLTVQDIIQNDSYYAIRNKATGTFAPHSALQYVTSQIQDLQVINETIEASEGNSLTISGIFGSNDLKPFNSIAQGESTDNAWIDVGVSINTDVYYGLKNEEGIITPPNATLTTVIEYSKSNSENVFLNLENYYIPFVYDQSGNVFLLQSYTASSSTISNNANLSSNSFLGNTNYLSLTNAYNSVTNYWSTTSYTLSISYNVSTNSTIYNVKDLSDNTVFTIDVKNNVIFLGSFIVSYIPQDYYRVERLLGPSDVDNVYTETFVNTDYANGKADLAPTLEGVYIGSTTLSMSPLVCPNLGSYQSFRVLGDFMSINEVGIASSPTSANELGITNAGSLDFQYVGVDSANYSAIFEFAKYRGYQSLSPLNLDQYYTISRDATTVTFDVTGGSLSDISDTLTTNMYYDEPFVVDNLTNSANELVANLNISGSFNYSIPPTNSTLTYAVTVTGDIVSVSISNPNYLGDASNIPVDPSATPVIDPKNYTASMTLKNYGQNDAYTFSGNWDLTGNLMAIRPSRVKLNNASYQYNKFNYQIQLIAAQIPLYKAINAGNNNISFNWLGNPALHGSQVVEADPGNLWALHGVYTISQLNAGINIGRKTIYQNPNAAITLEIAYIVSTPPYYIFDEIDTSGCPLIPYEYGSQYTDNEQTRYMPYISSSSGNLMDTFNPFAPSTTYLDISNNATIVVSDASYVNDITFTLSSPPSMTDAVNNPDSIRYGIIVPGTNLTVSEYVGLYSSTITGAHSNPIWNGPVTSIPSTPDISNNALLFRSRDDNGGINFSALQYPEDIGYPAGEPGYIEVLKTDNSSNWYNIDFNMGNSSWFNNNDPITYFDANAHGIRPTLYTVVDVNNPITQTNKRRVYKYTTSSSIDIDISGVSVSGLQTFNLTFNARSYHDFDISMNPTFPEGSSDCWKYNTILNNQVIPDASIVWTTDASFSQSYVSWAFGNSNTATKMLVELFSVQNDQEKWVYIQLEPFMRYMNQFNMQVGSVAWDGSVTAPLVSTRVVELAPQLSNPVLLNNTYSTQQYSESTL